MLDEGPSKLYDALSKVLGLDALVDAQTTLQQARTARDKAQKDADQDRKTILARLETLDRRARGPHKEALGKKDWGLAEVEAVLAGSPTTSREKDSAIDSSSAWPSSSPPTRSRRRGRKALRDAEERQTQAAQTVAGKSDQLATLLDHALRFHKAHGDGDCPVCGKPNALDTAWHQKKAQEAETLRQAAREATEARKGRRQRSHRRKLVSRRLRAPEETRSEATDELASEVTAASAEHALATDSRWTPPRRPRRSPPGARPARLVSALTNSVSGRRGARARRRHLAPPRPALAEWLPKAREGLKAAESLPPSSPPRSG